MCRSLWLGLVLSAFVCVPAVLGQQGTDVQQLLDSGDVLGAEALLNTQLEHAEATGDVSLRVLSARVQLAMASGDYEVAASFQKAFETSLAAIDPVDNKRSAWYVIEAYQQSLLARQAGDLEAAKTAIKSAISLFEAGAQIEPTWKGLLQYEASLAFDDENAYARRYANAAVAACQAAGMQLEMGYAYLRLGDLEWARDKKRRAFIDYDSALRAFRNADAPKRSIVEAQIHIAERLVENGEMRAAASRVELAKSALVAAGEPADLVARLNAIVIE